MLILALESSAKPASVAVCSDGELLGQYFQNSGLTHSRTLLAMAESLLKNLGITMADIGLIAVSCGPGSFTGVRIGVSAAKGLAWGLDKPVCGVSTLEAMAHQTPIPGNPGNHRCPGSSSNHGSSGNHGYPGSSGNHGYPGVLLCPVMDARRNQVYNALFAWEGGSLVRLSEDRAISLEDLANELHSKTYPVADAPDRCSLEAPETAPYCLLIGDGASLSYEYLSKTGIPCQIAPELMRWQTAYGVALAAMEAQPIPAIELQPNYLRPSQAEREKSEAAQPNKHN